MNNALVQSGLSFVLLAMVLIVGVAVVSMTYDVTKHAVNDSSFLTNVFTDLETGVTTLTGFIPVVAIALVAGLAIAYVMGVFGGGARR